MVNKWTTDDNESKDIETLILRIIKNHSVHLPSNGKISNRDKMSRFYRVLIHYITDEIDYDVVPLTRVSQSINAGAM